MTTASEPAPAAAPTSRLGGPLPLLGLVPFDEVMDETRIDGAIAALSRFSTTPHAGRPAPAAIPAQRPGVPAFGGRSDHVALQFHVPAVVDAPKPTGFADHVASAMLRMEIRTRSPDHGGESRPADFRTAITVSDNMKAVLRIEMQHDPDVVRRALRNASDSALLDATRTLLVDACLDMLDAMRERRTADHRRIVELGRLLAAVRWSGDPSPEGRGTPTAALPYADLASTAWTYVSGGPNPQMRMDDAHRDLHARVDAVFGPHFEVRSIASLDPSHALEVEMTRHHAILQKPDPMDAMRAIAEVEALPQTAARP